MFPKTFTNVPHFLSEVGELVFHHSQFDRNWFCANACNGVYQDMFPMGVFPPEWNWTDAITAAAVLVYLALQAESHRNGERFEVSVSGNEDVWLQVCICLLAHVFSCTAHQSHTSCSIRPAAVARGLMIELWMLSSLSCIISGSLGS